MVNSDFLDGEFPEPVDLPSREITGSGRFFNRELSWLAFNWRVLEEACNPEVPLLERVRFVSISADNLDEFYTVRVAGLRELARSSPHKTGADGLTPAEQLRLIEEDARKLMRSQLDAWETLREEMDQNGIKLVNRKNLAEADRDYLDSVYFELVFPVLTPLAIDPAHPFPFIPNAGFCLALDLRRKSDGMDLRALLPIPQQIDRFMKLPDGPQGEIRFIPLEEVLLEFLELQFPGYEEVGNCKFRVLRDSDLEVEEEAEDLVREFETALKRRRRGDAIRLTLSAGAPSDLRSFIIASLGVRDEEAFDLSGMIGLSDLSELVLESRPDLLWHSYLPRVPERVLDHRGDMFAAIRQKDMLLQHPYETFDMVVRFLQQAAVDPEVVAIKQTLYRTSRDSPIVDALCEAAESGKSVTALVELKARFDEAANIRQSRRLERAGAHVVYGFMNLKTHAKVSSVVRREGEQLVTYTHFGTGNYHPITAKIYTDLSLFTCDPLVGRDATRLVNFVSGYAKPVRLEHLAIAPLDLQERLLDCIEQEIAFARKGEPAEIWGKLNSVIDPDIIDALYRASAAGVRISLIVRGICGVRPGIKGLSENIRIKSVVGRFLEHSRIVCFGNGKQIPSNNSLVYISSADWMERNLKRRVETLVAIVNRTVKAQILRQIMAANLADRGQSWVLQHDGSYLRNESSVHSELFNCHRFFMEHPSLSGRGKAGDKDTVTLTHSKD